MWRITVFGSRKPVKVPGIGDEPSGLTVSRQPGRLVYSYHTYEEDIWRAPLTHNGAGRPVALISSTKVDESPEYSPDGRHIAFASNRSGNEEIWVSNADGSNPFQLTSFGKWAGSPAWSHDSQRIAFDCNAGGHWDIYVVNATGSKPVRLTSNGANNARPSWSHDDEWIYYSSHRTGQDQIWKIGVSGKPEIQVTKNGSDLTAVVSPDGQEVYYTRERGLWNIPVTGGTETKVLDSVCGDCFAPSKRGVYFVPQCSGERVLQFLDFGTRSIKRFPNIISACPLSVSPDEQWLLYEKDFGGSDLMLVENFR
jgi:tricorn protease-like protein